MKLLDIQEKRTVANSIYMAFFMEGTMPTQAEMETISLQDTVNNCLVARPYLNTTYATGGRLIMQPLNRATTTLIWPLHSAWQEVDGIYGKQVLPKCRMRRLRDMTVVANRSIPGQQTNAIIGAILSSRFVVDPNAGNIQLFSTSGGATVNLDSTDATKTIPIEYDFGADVEITGFLKNYSNIAAASGNYNAFNTAVLQAQLAGVWTDVATLTNASGASDATVYPITYTGGKVTARYFRVRKSDANMQQYFGNLRFLGKYVNGTPRTFGKIGYVLMMPIHINSADFQGGMFTSGATCNTILTNHIADMDDRQVAWNAYSVTDDPKQINNFDLFLPNGLTYEQGTDLYPPFFTCLDPITEMGAV